LGKEVQRLNDRDGRSARPLVACAPKSGIEAGAAELGGFSKDATSMTLIAPQKVGNLLTDLAAVTVEEVFQPLLVRPGCRIERIVSHGQVTPADQPYLQPYDEWVLLLAGAARVEVEGAETVLAPGDHMLIPANTSHRVTFTDPDGSTIWLAVHFDGLAG
jgi:cupin 2 domain-containing protein